MAISVFDLFKIGIGPSCSHIAVMLGLIGHAPDTVDVDAVPALIDQVRTSQALTLLGTQPISFQEKDDILMYRREAMAEHPNGMKFSAFDADGLLLKASRYLSVGGGFVVTLGAANEALLTEYKKVPYLFTSGH